MVGAALGGTVLKTLVAYRGTKTKQNPNNIFHVFRLIGWGGDWGGQLRGHWWLIEGAKPNRIRTRVAF